MRKRLIVVVALLLLSAPAWAGGIGPMFASWDTSNVGDDQGHGVRITVDLGPQWNLEMRGSWLDSFKQVGDGILFKLDATPIDVGLSYGFHSGGRVEPYLGAGFTYVLLSVTPNDTRIARLVETDVPNEIGVFYVAGLDVPVGSRLVLFGEVTYRQIKARVASPDFEDFNSDFTGAGINAGLMISF